MPVEQQSTSPLRMDRRVRTTAAFFLLLFLSAVTSTLAKAQVGPVSQPNAKLPCDEPPCDGGGGGGGGGGGPVPPAAGGPLTFHGATSIGTIIGGVSGRQTPAVASNYISNQISQIWTAFNEPYPGEYNDQYGDQYVYYYDGGSTYAQHIMPVNGNAFSDANPAAQTVQIPGQGLTLFVAINSQQNPATNNGGFTDLLQLNKQTNAWTVSGFNNLPYTQYSPSLTASTQYLFTGVTNAVDHTLTLCRTDITVVNGASSCTNFPGTKQMNFNPSLAYFNGVLYIGFEEYDNTHALRMFTSTDNGQTIAENTNITNNNEDTTSYAPSLAVFHNALYVGFRSNDGGAHFLYRYSTDGVNFTQSTQPTNDSMGGGPALVPFTFNGVNYLYNYFTTNDGNHTLVLNAATN